MSKTELINIIKEESKNNDYVVIGDVEGKVWGSNASKSSLKMGGGKFYIIESEQIIYNDIIISNITYSVEQFADKILQDWSN